MANTELKISLAILMGLPASGKTTFAKSLEAYSKENSQEFLLHTISFDDFVPHEIQARISEQNGMKTLRKNFIHCVDYILSCLLVPQSEEEDAVKILEDFGKLSLSPKEEFLGMDLNFKEKTENSIKSIQSEFAVSAAKNNLVLLIDDNNYYTSMRNEFYQQAKKHGTGFCIIFCKTSLKTCRQRNSLRDSAFQVPDKTIVEMSLKLEEPNPLINICDSFSLQIQMEDNQEQNIPLVIALLENSIRQPVIYNPPEDRTEEIERERRICSQNEIHQADQILRKWINKELSLASFMKQSKSNDGNSGGKRELSKDLNKRKTIVLDKLRSGEYKILADVGQDLEFRSEVLQLFNVK